MLSIFHLNLGKELEAKGKGWARTFDSFDSVANVVLWEVGLRHIFFGHELIVYV